MPTFLVNQPNKFAMTWLWLYYKASWMHTVHSWLLHFSLCVRGSSCLERWLLFPIRNYYWCIFCNILALKNTVFVCIKGKLWQIPLKIHHFSIYYGWFIYFFSSLCKGSWNTLCISDDGNCYSRERHVSLCDTNVFSIINMDWRHTEIHEEPLIFEAYNNRMHNPLKHPLNVSVHRSDMKPET